MAAATVVQSLWFGGTLPLLQRISIASFLTRGHEYHLYTYGTLKGVPPGAVLRDASEILPASEIFADRRSTGFAAFADIFRYKLLSERGGWWVDMDFVCLRPFDFSAEYVFASEHTREGAPPAVPNNAIMKAPAGAPCMKYAVDVCRSKDPDEIVWAELGPQLMADLIPRFSLEAAVVPPEVFCPIPWFELETFFAPDHRPSFSPLTCAVHLWNAKWKRDGRPVNAAYSLTCLYEQWKLDYLDWC